MAAQRIRAANSNGLPRCKSEGTLIDLSDGFSETSFNDVKVPSPSAFLVDNPTPFGNAKEVIAIKDYCPTNFTTLKFSKGDHLYVLDTSGGEWWYAHNTTEMGYIPSSYVQPINYRNSTLSDSGMIDNLLDSPDEGVKELDLLGEWMDDDKKGSGKANNNPFWTGFQTNPFLNGNLPIKPSLDELVPKSTVDLLLFDPAAASFTGSSSATTNSTGNIFDELPSTNRGDLEQPIKWDNPFFRSKRSYSLSELSVLQARSETPTSSGFFSGLKSPTPEQFQSREDFRTAWLNHRKLARSCHDLDLLGQNPGWGQTQPVETNIVCKLDSSGGAVQLPDTHISIHVPQGHVAPGETQQISMKALLDPPLELNSDKSSTIGPVLEVKLSNMEVKSFITLEMKVSAEIRNDLVSKSTVGLHCLRSDTKEGPYTPIPLPYSYGDTVQVQLENLEPCMYVAIVAQGQNILYPSTVWDYIHKKITVGVYGPKHIHPSFKTVVTIFGHECAPKTLMVSEVTRQVHSPAPVALQLWGKHQFVLSRPQDLKICMFSNMTNYEVRASEQAKIVRGFQMKLGRVSRLIFPIMSHDPNELSDFTLRVQVKDDSEAILTQFCVQTPLPPPKSAIKPSGQRRFLKKNEVGKIILSPLAATTKYPTFQERPVASLKFGKLLKTVVRQNKNHYLLEYKKGDVVALLSEEKIKLKGQLWTKEWYIGYYQGKIGLVHTKNVLVVGKIRPSYFSGPDLTTSGLLEQILRPCKFLTYIYASVRTLLMENISSWRVFADALGYANLPLTFFCRAELDSEPERVASVLEKLKEDCNNTENKDRKSFQKELMMALLKMDCQGLVVRLIQDFVLLTTAVEVAQRWRELAEKLAKVSKQQMDAYESPHRDKNGMVDSEAMWKPAYDFLLTWSNQIGDSYRDVIQELHLGLDKMKNPITKRWKHLTGTLILVNSLDILRAAAFSPVVHEDFAI
ncbi:SH3 domain-binding protein 4 [Ornithorhynchus anatinus]|uniref:SH3 domain-binding protein 4 n=1 Tax=Ornithorhynchus anatinus TaxID=9258 RepID=F7DJ60_ORNAN|nr:SH3 domain-binding protein 4 [Ornithorhynchus anatinus]XP_007664265.1 SH3 domain-binding protein 4 [Ornithorhynchus anatinus]XP_028924715.1 SH3 domain-binding protein 4 [Ornithorhynchus anatinus]XP_028924716.1 SH3 domain-binding protein 4 [Ornithorhynchus anatinus]